MRSYSNRTKIFYLCLFLCFVYLSTRFTRLITQHPSHSSSPYQPRPIRFCGLKCPPILQTHKQINFNSSHSREIAQRIFPFKAGPDTWRRRNQDELVRLLDCQKMQGRLQTCYPKDQQIVLLGTVHFSRVLEGIFAQKASFPAGEAIWADALLWALNQLKYPYLMVDGPNHNETNALLGEVYELLAPNVKMVIGDYLSSSCLKNKACVKSDDKPSGIPHHKLFVFDGFGQDVGHPLGRNWHLTFYPQEEKNFTYLGLTIEHYCHKFGVVPAHKRKNKVYILGKDRSYLHPPAPRLYPEKMWLSITNATGIEFTMGTQQKNADIQPNQETDKKNKLIDGIIDIGSQSRDQFIYEIQHHRAIIGLGWPVQPSTPLEALCVGTPYINPVWLGRRSQTDRSKWHTQHPYLARFDPPYVYNVQDNREDDVLEALQQIMKNPLNEPFIPEDMKKENYLDRIDKLIQLDWEHLAKTKMN